MTSSGGGSGGPGGGAGAGDSGDPGGAGLKLSRKQLIWTIISVVVAIIGIIVAVVVTGGGSGNSVSGGDQGGQITGNGNTMNNFQNFQNGVSPNPSDLELREKAKQFAGTPPPPGGGPWPFIASGTPSGLIVRTSGDREGVQIGSVGNNATVYADCQLSTSFDPRPDLRSEGVWMRVRWPSAEPTRSFMNSGPGDPSIGFVFKALTVPAGHNGVLPPC